MTERQEVEVVNGACRGAACNYYEDGGEGVCIAQVSPGSLTEARLRLADAAEKWIASYENEDLHDEMYAAGRFLAALRTARGEG